MSTNPEDANNTRRRADDSLTEAERRRQREETERRVLEEDERAAERRAAERRRLRDSGIGGDDDRRDRRGAGGGAGLGRVDEEAPPDGDALPARGVTINANQLAVLGTFKGQQEEDIDLFLMQTKRVAQAFAWPSTNISQMVQTRLQDQAAIWLRSHLALSPESDMLHEWVVANQPTKGLRAALIARFRNGANERAAVDAVSDLKQRPQESVDEFYSRVGLAMDVKNFRATEEEKLLPAYRARLHDEVFTFFGAGLQEEIRIQAMGGPTPPKTDTALLEAARNAEQERKRTKKPKYLAELGTSGPEEGATCDADGATPDQLQVAELKAELDAMKKQLKRTMEGRTDKVRCFRCKKFGHMSYDCTLPPPHELKKKKTTDRGRRVRFIARKGKKKFTKDAFIVSASDDDDEDEEDDDDVDIEELQQRGYSVEIKEN